MISFKTTMAEHATIERIVERAEGISRDMGQKLDRMRMFMDISAVHCNGCPLDLNELLAFPGFDFAHDVFGIEAHIDRETGKLLNCFTPRCARPAKVSTALSPQ